MEKFTHDPSEYIRGIQQILISDKKRLGFLLGGGTSLAKKNDLSLTVPGISELTNYIVEEITKENETYGNVLREIKDELGEQNYNIETILSNLEQKFQIIGNSKLNSIDRKGFHSLIIELKRKIREKISVHKSAKNENIEALVQTDFAEWIKQADRKFPIEIFTTNYDYLLELGLECKNVPYYDGFSGSYQPFFFSSSIEDFSFLPQLTKLWKIHGSLGWHFDEVSKKILRRESDDDDILIYPSMLKYRDSKKQPYISLMDRLSCFLKQDDSVLITCGYSFNDEHINERIISALNTNTTSHVVALFFGEIEKDSQLFKLTTENNKISGFGFRSAIIGCKDGPWQLRTEPDKNDTPNINLYFDEDGHTSDDEEKGKEKKGEEVWTGKGKLFLPHFSKLVEFLKSMIVENEIKELGLNAKK